MKKQTIILLIAALLCLLLFGTYFALVIHDAVSDEKEDETKNAQLLVMRFVSSDISCLDFDMSDKPISLYRHNGRWMLSENEHLPVSESKVRELISKIEIITALRVVNENCEDFGEYGLESPKHTLKVTEDGHTHEFCFGEYNEYYDGYYFCVKGTNKIYIVSGDYVEAFDIELEELLENDSLPDMSQISHVDFTSRHGYSISFDTKKCSDDEKKLADVILSLSIGRFIDYGGDNFDSYFLLDPATLILDGKDTLKLAPGEEEDIIYLLINDSEMIYTVDCGSAENIGILLEFINKSK